jgi:hypothetical protein
MTPGWLIPIKGQTDGHANDRYYTLLKSRKEEGVATQEPSVHRILRMC